MSVHVKIPTPFRRLTGGLADVVVDGGTVGEAVENLERLYPGFKTKMFSESGALKRFVVIYVNEHDIRTRDELATRLEEGDVVAIVPAIAGGCCGQAGRGAEADGC
jgi:molybdopterin synthase sulfur carrier subunit